jgi:hypothetical protein
VTTSGAARPDTHELDAGRQARRAGLDRDLRIRLSELMDEGRRIWDRFDVEVRQQEFHPFVAADYELMLDTLLRLREPGLSFLEWGSASGVITIMADLLGYDACGIEIDPDLVDTARELAQQFGSSARFVAGSFLPAGYQWRSSCGDTRLGTIGDARSGYLELGRPLEEFDIVYAYPWSGEDAMMRDIMKRYGRRGARLLLNSGSAGLTMLRDGRALVESDRSHEPRTAGETRDGRVPRNDR